jgi:hypothetical protein
LSGYIASANQFPLIFRIDQSILGSFIFNRREGFIFRESFKNKLDKLKLAENMEDNLFFRATNRTGWIDKILDLATVVQDSILHYPITCPICQKATAKYLNFGWN